MVETMIFHTPMTIIEEGKKASQLRPVKIRDAFRTLGYNVIEVSGPTKQRLRKMRWVKENLSSLAPSFVYSELSSMPFALAQSAKQGIHPFADLSFFRSCRQARVPVGAFYRDIYWKFDSVDSVRKLPRLPGYKDVARFFYRLDEVLLPHAVDTLFLPSMRMAQYLNGTDRMHLEALPPGLAMVKVKHERHRFSDRSVLRLLYVGALGDFYQLDALLEAVESLSDVELILCVPPDQWREQSSEFKKRVSRSARVVHATGVQLEELYDQVDIGMLMMKPIEYRSFAAPYKFFEYLGHSLPVIATAGTNVGDMVSENGLGWSIPYSAQAISNQLKMIVADRSQLDDVTKRVTDQRVRHTWEARADFVARTLVGKEGQ